MSLNTYAGLLKRGNDASKPDPTYWLIGFLYHAIDTGNLYYYQDSTTRVLLQGAEKAEILKNKSINFAENNVSGVIKDPFTSMKREGIFVPAATHNASFQLALKGAPLIGTYTLVKDGAEGYVGKFEGNTSGKAGIVSNPTTSFVTRRGYNPRIKARFKVLDPATQITVFGFASALPFGSGSALDNSTAGAIIAQSTGSAVYIIRNGIGDGVTPATNFNTTTNKATGYANYEIQMDATEIRFYIDGVLVRTVTSNLPALDRDIYLILGHERSTFVRDITLSKMYFSDDILP